MPIAYDPVLQSKLDKLWFTLPKDTPEGSKAERQSMLVREFQIAARGSHGARDATGGIQLDAARLTQVELKAYQAAQLPGSFIPTGVADPATIKAIDAWLDPTANLRCPVVFQAREAGSHRKPWDKVVRQGLLFHDEDVSTKLRIFVSDFTGRYPLDQNGKPKPIPVGTSTRWLADKAAARLTGTACTARQSYQAAFDPVSITGQPWSELDESQRATFRVLAAIASVEAEGVIDGINAYDHAVFSAGPYHYTAFPNKALGKAELGAFFSYASSRSPDDAKALFSSFGLGPTDRWDKALFDANQRVYRAGLGYIAGDGTYQSPTSLSERDWVRTWPSFCRIQNAFRTQPVIRNAIWPFARQRIIDLLKTRWASDAGPPGAHTLGDVFQSEASVALLLRWHVYTPGRVVSGGVSSVVPAGIVASAGLAKLDISKWTDEHEAKLIGAFAGSLKKHGKLRRYASQDLRNTLAAVVNWSHPQWADGATGPSLGRSRDFTPYSEGAPFPGGSN
jgi:hypothetical protein